MVIAVDFDGTIVENRYPKIGEELPFACETLKMLQKDQHHLILWTVREGQALMEAIEWCKKRGVVFYAVNKDYPEENGHESEHFSRKIKADIFIDDRQVGGLPDWGQIYHMIHDNISLKQLIREESRMQVDRRSSSKKKHWWSI